MHNCCYSCSRKLQGNDSDSLPIKNPLLFWERLPRQASKERQSPGASFSPRLCRPKCYEHGTSLLPRGFTLGQPQLCFCLCPPLLCAPELEGNTAPPLSGECKPEAIPLPDWQSQGAELQMPGALLVHEHSCLLEGLLVHMRAMAGIFTA